MLHHINKLLVHITAVLEEGGLHRISHKQVPRRLALLCTFEAARIEKRATELRAEKWRVKAKQTRESLHNQKRGLGRA